MSGDRWGAGDRAKWSDHGEVVVGDRKYPLIWGEHPHSRRDNQHYVDMGDDEPVGFDGHRILIDVTLKSRNYLKSSGLSGDEVRKAGECQILADREVVFSFFYRDVQWALLHAHQLITELLEHSSGWMMKRERDRLVGRAIYYREVPAVVERLITDQGCLIIASASGAPFPPPVWSRDECDDEESTVKTSVTDPNIWWHREVSP